MDFPTTIFIITATCFISFLAFKNSKLLGKLIFHPPAVSQQNQWYRLLSSGFIHKDFNHLLFNMLTLFFFGRELEPLFTQLQLGGAVGYLIFYLAAIVISEIPTYLQHKTDENYYALGASGAVSAVVFALVLFAPWSLIYLKFFIPIPFVLYAIGYVGYSMYMDKKGIDNVGHAAHLWGALFGIAFIIIAYPDSLKIFMAQITHPHFG